MTLIDQRILIDAPPQIIWEFISDPYKLAEWHAGYTSVSVLTTQQTGQGTRRRCAVAGGGKDVIEQITAWVEGLGYEYELVEGGPYRAMRGRIRLQPGPDGTSVQWTVEYQPRGPFSFLRDQMSGRKQFAAMMAASLRELRQQVNALGLRMDDAYRARLGIQGRLNAAERAQYQRRHPVPTDAESPQPAAAEGAPPAEAVPSADAAPATPGEDVIAPPAPAISFDADTEPKPPVGLREAIAAQQDSPIPAPTPPPQAVEETPAPPVEATPEEVPLPPTIAPPSAIVPPEPQPPASAPPEEPEPDYRRVTPPRGIPAVLPSAESAPSPFVRPTPQDAESIPPREVPGAPASSAGEQAEPGGTLPPPTPKTDTGEVSIWEVFGLRRPSEQDEDALQGLIQSVEARKAAEQRRETLRRGLKSPLRARLHASASGLRARLALLRARVRAHALRTDR